MATYSHSKLSTFEQCRQKYKFQYIDKVKIPGQSVEAFLGSMVHEALEKLYEDVRHSKVPTVDELLDFYRKRWRESWTDDVRIVREDYTQKNYRDMGVEFIQGYYEHYHPFDDGRILGLETQDFLDLGGGHRLHVRIDRLVDEGGGVYSVVDYKTNRSLPKQEDLDADRQLAAYSIWVRERFFDARQVKLVWHYLAHDRKMESERTPEQLEELKKAIRATIAEIEACRSFEPTTSSLCDWCDFKEMCPAWIHEVKVSELSGKDLQEDDGVKLVDRLAELTAQEGEIKEQIEEVKEDIVAYARKFGLDAIAGTEARATVSSTDTPLMPKKGSIERINMEEKLKEMGLYDSLLSLDAVLVKKLAPETLDRLGLERAERHQVRLGKRKITP